MPLAASIPSEPQAISRSAVGGVPRRRSSPVAEDRQADRDDEQVADVDVGEGGGEERHHWSSSGTIRPPKVPSASPVAFCTSSRTAEPRITASVA